MTVDKGIFQCGQRQRETFDLHETNAQQRPKKLISIGSQS